MTEHPEMLDSATRVQVHVPTATRNDGQKVYTESVDKWRRELGRLRIALIDATLDRVYQRFPRPYRPETPWPVRKPLRYVLLVGFAITAAAAFWRRLHGSTRTGAGLWERI